VNAVEAFAIGRLAFGGVALAAPVATGRILSGEGGTTSDAAALIRGMGGRELGIGAGMLHAARGGSAVAPWLVAGVLADAGDMAGIGGAWSGLAPDKRAPGIAFAAVAAVAGAVLLATRADS
jgi:peptide-methionine (R)-S-oxide reductase